jgi:N-acetylglutamate synthase-like GNAT family acetyltransferase
MNIKKAELKDKKNILEILNLLYIKMPNFVWDKEEFVEKQINNGEYYIAQENENVVGVISFRNRNNKMHIETLAVAKGHQSNGVGSKLINFAKEYTEKNNLKILCAYAFYQYNTADFYLKNGFILLKKYGKYEGNKYYCFEMKF